MKRKEAVLIITVFNRPTFEIKAIARRTQRITEISRHDSRKRIWYVRNGYFSVERDFFLVTIKHSTVALIRMQQGGVESADLD